MPELFPARIDQHVVHHICTKPKFDSKKSQTNFPLITECVPARMDLHVFHLACTSPSFCNRCPARMDPFHPSELYTSSGYKFCPATIMATITVQLQSWKPSPRSTNEPSWFQQNCTIVLMVSAELFHMHVIIPAGS